MDPVAGWLGPGPGPGRGRVAVVNWICVRSLTEPRDPPCVGWSAAYASGPADPPRPSVPHPPGALCALKYDVSPKSFSFRVPTASKSVYTKATQAAAGQSMLPAPDTVSSGGSPVVS